MNKKNNISKMEKMNNDIFNNSYNTLSYDYQEIEPNLKVSNQSYVNSPTLDINYLELEKLKEQFLQIFEKSPFKFKNKRELNHKEYIIEIFHYYSRKFEDELLNEVITKVDFVLALAETLNLDYGILYHILPLKFKSDVHSELNINIKTNKHKLF